MTLSAKRIVILFHKNDRYYDPSRYIVHHMAEFWRADGHEIIYVYGVKRYVPADLLLVHVNLSVVPEEYLEFASRYPIALNGRVRDIRKSTLSRNLVTYDGDWDGPVIVKTDLNYAGQPERLLRRSWLERRWPYARGVKRAVERLSGNRRPFDEPADYKIFERTSEVPRTWFENPELVVEKFRPEFENGRYHTRLYQFLGDRETCMRMSSDHPVVKAQTRADTEEVEPHEIARSWRKELGLDYGKIDYSICDGEVVLLDANKTTGAAGGSGDSPDRIQKRSANRNYRAVGLYSYFSA
jgi:hypothetical protein